MFFKVVTFRNKDGSTRQYLHLVEAVKKETFFAYDAEAVILRKPPWRTRSSVAGRASVPETQEAAPA
jgi:hypothetical protein